MSFGEQTLQFGDFREAWDLELFLLAILSLNIQHIWDGVDTIPIQTYLNAAFECLFNTVIILLKIVMVLLIKAANYG